jgi:hypothetical protein
LLLQRLYETDRFNIEAEDLEAIDPIKIGSYVAAVVAFPKKGATDKLHSFGKLRKWRCTWDMASQHNHCRVFWVP